MKLICPKITCGTFWGSIHVPIPPGWYTLYELTFAGISELQEAGRWGWYYFQLFPENRVFCGCFEVGLRKAGAWECIWNCTWNMQVFEAQ